MTQHHQTSLSRPGLSATSLVLILCLIQGCRADGEETGKPYSLWDRLMLLHREIRDYPEYGYKSQCYPVGRSCDPWTSSCCDGLQCMTYARRHCMDFLDECACLSGHTQHAERLAWYKRSSVDQDKSWNSYNPSYLAQQENEHK